MTPDQLLTFAVVAELGSISRAAETLHLSQPAVSGQLRLLQDAFAQPLYRRVGRGIQLTAAGEELAGLARQLRQTYERARLLREAMAGLQTGSLMIGASTTPASYLLPYLVADFRAVYPTINVALSSGNTTDITDHLSQFDLAFIEGAVPPDLPSDTDVREWVRDEVVAVVRHDHPLVSNNAAVAAKRKVALSQLSEHPLIMREAGSGVRNQVTQAFVGAGLPMNIAIELAGVEGVLEGVRAGLGIGFVSAMAMQHQGTNLCALAVKPPHRLNRHISVLVPHAHSLSAAAQAFLQRCLPPA